MEYGIQWRSVYLSPPTEDDFEGILRDLDREEVARAFALEPSRAASTIRGLELEGRLVRGIVRRVLDQRRIGFALLYEPALVEVTPRPIPRGVFGVWVENLHGRECCHHTHAADAMTHYLLDHLEHEDWAWWFPFDDRVERAMVRLMGFRTVGKRTLAGRKYALHRIGRFKWGRRRARLEQAQALRSPHRPGFGVIAGPRYLPNLDLVPPRYVPTAPLVSGRPLEVPPPPQTHRFFPEAHLLRRR